MLPETMRAVVAYGIHDYRFEPAYPTPKIANKGDIIIKVEACGICAGDLKAFAGGGRFWGDDEFSAYVEPPCIPGHEFVGRVAQTHPDYGGEFRVGDRVTAEQIVPCGHCHYCEKGLYWVCDPHDVFGFKNYLNGGMAEYLLLPEKSIKHHVPESFSTEQALLIEPFSCSLHAVERGRVEASDVVVVSGAGTLGLGMLASLRLGPLCTVISVDVNPARLPLALSIGADIALNPNTDDVWGEIARLTGGVGCDVYIECAGHPSSVLQGLQWIRKKGRFVEFSVFGEKTLSDWSLIGDAKEIDIYGASLSPHCFPRVIEGIGTGKIPTQDVVTHILPLERFGEAFQLARGEGVKVALRVE